MMNEIEKAHADIYAGICIELNSMKKCIEAHIKMLDEEDSEERQREWRIWQDNFNTKLPESSRFVSDWKKETVEQADDNVLLVLEVGIGRVIKETEKLKEMSK